MGGLGDRSIREGEEDVLLLLVTMCIVGLPVEVQVKDGSVYSGVFHTACLDNHYGIILKMARKIRKGKCDTELEIGALIDTLVILSCDLVQIVTKGILLPAEGIVGNAEAVTGSIPSSACNGELERQQRTLESDNAVFMRHMCRSADKLEEKISGSNSSYVDTEANGGIEPRYLSAKPLENINEVKNGKADSSHVKRNEEASFPPNVPLNERQAGEVRTLREEDPCSHVSVAPTENTIVHEMCSSCSHVSAKKMTNGANCENPASVHIKPEAPDNKMQNSEEDIPSLDVHVPTTSATSAIHVKTASSPSSSAQSSILLPPKKPLNNTDTKEFKLNPEAKTFLPSCTNSRSALPAVSTVANAAYIPHCPAMVPIATSQPTIEIGTFASRSSAPTKFIQYNNVVFGNNGAVSQLPHPFIGHVGARQQAVRFSSQYHPVHTGPTYLVPNSPVMVGRLGQLMYVHPVSQDAIQGIPSLPQISPRPLLTPYHINLPMLQGNATQGSQLCVTPPLFTGGQQPLLMPRPIPFSSPLSAIQAIPVPGGNNLFGSKF